MHFLDISNSLVLPDLLERNLKFPLYLFLYSIASLPEHTPSSSASGEVHEMAHRELQGPCCILYPFITVKVSTHKLTFPRQSPG